MKTLEVQCQLKE
jgi:Cyclin, N-terminal domain